RLTLFSHLPAAGLCACRTGRRGDRRAGNAACRRRSPRVGERRRRARARRAPAAQARGADAGDRDPPLAIRWPALSVPLAAGRGVRLRKEVLPMTAQTPLGGGGPRA